jgi:hypothetical protein
MKVYVAQPISRGDANKNFYLSCEVQLRLIQGGHSPFNPGLSVANYGAQRELKWSDWLYTMDLPWLRASDIVLRLPGASAGAEIELKEARHYGIPVVTPSFFGCLNDLFEPGPQTLCDEDHDNLMRFLSWSRRELIRDAALQGFARVRQ